MMKKQMLAVIACLAAGILISSCSKDDKQQVPPPSPVSDEIIAKINALGFSTANIQKTTEGYLVEGDILLTAGQLNERINAAALRVGKVEQYRHQNLVTGLPRVITVKVTGLPAPFIAGLDTALMRYNKLNLRLRFQRVTSGTTALTIEGFNQGPVNGQISLAYSGFPSNTGNPYPTIRLNVNVGAFGLNPNVLYVGSVIQHEIGHCIGMLHTDYMDRSFSCGGAPVRENVNAIWIPGTPMGPDPNSWMLACSNGGNRTFNANDIIALKYLYY